MKRFTMIVALLFAFGGSIFAQDYNKIAPELQKEMDSRKGDNKMFRIIITMTDKYDQEQMSRQVQYMAKDERRAYVIDELKRFSKACQQDLMQLLEDGSKADIVEDLNPFWIFNGVSCITNREMIASLSQRKDIKIIESDEIRNMLPENEKAVKVTEQHRELAWHVAQVHANDVWSLGYDGTGIVVAIIDTGVNYNHVDLADHMWDGGTQYPNHGYDFVNNDNDPMDDVDHGSHCAGIVAGDGTSGTQTGIAPNATIMALKVLDSDGSGTNADIREAMQFAITNNADVVSMSLGASGASGSSTDRQIFVNMMNAGIVASVAAGNDGEYYSNRHIDPNYNTYYAVPKNVGSPGNCPPPWHNPDQTLTGGHSAVVTVGASNRNDRKSTFSSFGPVTWYGVNGYNDYRYQSGSTTNIGLIKPDIIAPGTDITSSSNTDNYGFNIMPGTSMATPCVSGIMALLLHANPNLTPAQIDEILETTALPVDFRVTKNNYTGAGRADALAAIDAVITQATKPTDLSLETCGGNVNLSWTASTAPAGYCIYRDNEQVGTTTATTYTDENVGAGQHVYYVRANDNSGRQSVHSNALVCTIQPYATVPEDLTIGWNGTNAELDWDDATVSNTLSSANLFFSDDPYTAFGGSANSTIYWGMCFNPEELRPYQGMSIDQVSIPIYTTGIAYTLRIYRGTTYGNTTGTPVYTQSFTPTSGNWAYKTMTLTTPYALTDISQDLWITFSATLGSSTGYPVVVGEYDGPNSNCFYMGDKSSVNDMCWTHYPDYGSDYNYAVCIKAHLTRTTNYTPSYNVYLDNSSKASGLSVTDYTDTPTLHSGENIYYVTSKIGNNESCPSNDAKIIVIDNAQTESNDIAIDNTLVYIINPTGVLTTSGSLVSTDPTRFILEDGAQLIHNSEGVKATVKKDIAAYTADDNGWNFIASPVTESITPSEDNGLLTNNYDLYKFDQSQDLEWRNIEAGSFSTIDHKTGYLYANSGNTTIEFAGTLAASTPATDLVYDADATLKGFNLIGNPYPCNTTITNDFYEISGGDVILAQNGRTIAPCESVLVKATNVGQSVTFSKAVSAKAQNATDCLDIVVAQGKATVDRARVRFGEGIGMEKLSLNDDHSQISLWQDGQEFAMVYANGQTELPLNFKAIKDGTYTLNFETEKLDLDYLHLIDNMTGNDIDLLATPNYTFEAKTSDYPSRFRLLFSPAEETESSTDSFAYFANGYLHVFNQGEASMQLIDMTGHILLNEALQGNLDKAIDLVPGVYIIRLISEKSESNLKVVVD